MPSATLHRRLLPGLLALSLCAAGLEAASPTDVPGVHNFHQVNEHVYRGAQPSSEGFANLAKLGVKTVIDLRGERSEANLVERAGLRYVRMPWSGFKAPTDREIATVLSLLNDSSDWPVFVHCKRGADRTGTAIACYRISHDHWSNEKALAEAKSFGMSSLEIAMRHYIENFGGAQLAHLSPLTPALLTAPAPAQP
jgi:tyrosine-protein phosphatase SIW14